MLSAAPPRYLLDTNVLLAYTRAGELGQWIEATYSLKTAKTVPLISAVAEGEMLSLARQFGWGEARQRRLRELIRVFVSVPLETGDIVEAYALIDDHCRRIGRPMGKNNDVWIAATAHATGAVLLTTDRDFDHLDPDFLKRDWIDPASRL
jgi:tRNA(fMet)-specific endonuclease VapC